MVRCVGIGPEGMPLELELTGRGPVALLVADASPGLPGEAGAALQRLRDGADAVTSQTGDLTVVSRRLGL